MAIDAGAPQSKAEQIADSVTTRLLARLSMICLLPILGFLFFQLWDGQKENSKKLEAISDRLARIETRLDFAPASIPMQRAATP